MTRVPFHGDQLEVTLVESELWVSIARVCKALGLDAAAQTTALRGQPWASLRPMFAIADGDGRLCDIECIALDSFPMWLATITLEAPSNEGRAKLALYQREAARALRERFFPRVPGTLDEQSLRAMLREEIVSARPYAAFGLNDIRALLREEISALGVAPGLGADAIRVIVRDEIGASTTATSSSIAPEPPTLPRPPRRPAIGTSNMSATVPSTRELPVPILAVEHAPVIVPPPAPAPVPPAETSSTIRAAAAPGPTPPAVASMLAGLSGTPTGLNADEIRAILREEMARAAPPPDRALPEAKPATSHNPRFDGWNERIAAHLETLPEGAEFSLKDVLHDLLGLAAPTPGDSTVAGTIVRRLGWKRIERRSSGGGGKKERVYQRDRAPSGG